MQLKSADPSGSSESLYVLLRRWVQNDPTLAPDFPAKLDSDARPFLQSLTATEEKDEEMDERPPQIQALGELVPAWEVCSLVGSIPGQSCLAPRGC